MKQFLVPTLFILMQGFLFSQDRLEISLVEVLDKVQELNIGIKLSEQDAKMAKYDYNQTNVIFLPQISISHTGIATTNPLMAFGSKLNQEILTQADFIPSSLNDPDQVESYATRISFEQPLINMDGFYQRKAAKTTMLAKELQAIRTKDHYHFEAKKAYSQLQLAYKGVEVLQMAYNAAKSTHDVAENSYEQGLLQKADLLQAKVRLTEVENQLQQAKSNMKNASDYLGFLMNAAENTIYQPIEILVPIDFDVEEEGEIENRADVRAMQLVSKAYKANMNADKMTFLPKLKAFGSYEMYDDDVFQTNAKGYLFGASLSWDILKGGKRFAQTGKSKANYEKSKQEYQQYVSKSNLEVQRTRRAMQDSKSRLKTSKLAMKQAEESLRIRTNRYKEGLEKTNDVLIAEAMYAQAQMMYYQTIYEFNNARFYLAFLTKE
ncbi:TolC family protein [Flagellimonas pacifica]|uniref:Outer membrane protein TolC n=1 Tax=Flagellimonas pacifica TaxID=1247520 RepID=A0A285MDR6_9FLAO|nr:TolC family protein [Allomuricauda parva]SNY95310.1 Outer membrane protein TolC [Allomuricauda parva]